MDCFLDYYIVFKSHGVWGYCFLQITCYSTKTLPTNFNKSFFSVFFHDYNSSMAEDGKMSISLSPVHQIKPNFSQKYQVTHISMTSKEMHNYDKNDWIPLHVFGLFLLKSTIEFLIFLAKSYHCENRNRAC